MDLSIMQSVIPDFTIENFNLFDEIICLKWEKVKWSTVYSSV